MNAVMANTQQYSRCDTDILHKHLILATRHCEERWCWDVSARNYQNRFYFTTCLLYVTLLHVMLHAVISPTTYQVAQRRKLQPKSH
ncbi:hypothetical protein J6590_049548 [Homalodisca vitripennis]|nr:hypothetical protein J6590_049548 [Homalodisca vitripennis]